VPLATQRPRPFRHPARRDEILRAACRAIVERGFADTRVADIAAAAGSSTGTVHYYFESKEEVLVAALRWATDRLLDRLDTPPEAPALARLARLLELSIPSRSPKARRDEYVLWIEMWTVVLHNRARLKALEDLSLRWRSLFFDILEAGTASGELRPVADPPLVAERLVALVDGLGFETVVGYSWATPARMRATLVQFVAEQLRIEPGVLERQMRSEER
jgi:AcrR family transcriptional regulator